MRRVGFFTVPLVLVLACAARPAPPAPDAPEPIPSATQPTTPLPTPQPSPPGEDAEDAGPPRGDPDASSPGPLAPFHLLGRLDTRVPSAPRVGFPGAQIRVRVADGGVAVTLAERGVSHWDVTIDGAPQPLLVVSGASHAYPVATGPGTHDLALTKRTETSLGVTTIEAVAPLPGSTIVPSPEPTGRRIEFVGDSITCGYGVLGTDPTCTFSADTESETSAWAALASKELGALHTSVCWSGLGVYRNYEGQTTDTMPDRYDRAIGDDPQSTWSPSGFEPDVVVVALGTNDFAGGKGDPGPVFADAYVAFLAKVRAAHPAAAIVIATSPMLSTTNHELHRAYLVQAMGVRAAAGDANISLLDVPAQDEADGLGCGYHPSKITQQKMATMLVAHLKQTLGW